MENIHDVLVTMSVMNDGDWNGIYRMLKEKVPVSHEEVQEAYTRISCPCLAFTDREYPDAFKSVWHPPLTTFYRGDISLLNHSRILAVIGSREPSQYTVDTVSRLLQEAIRLDPTIAVVSGMARGVDAVAMRTALDAGAKVIGIMGSGIDSVYPESSRDIYDRCIAEGGLIISEYPGSTSPKRDNFPFRNRLIAALSRCILACQVGQRSGTYITIRYGLDLGKNIALIPQRLEDGEMTNLLFRDGATLVTEACDIVRELC